MLGRQLIDRSARLPRPDVDANQGFRGCRFRLDKEVFRCAKHEPQVGGNSTKKTTGRTSERLPGEADESGVGFTNQKGPRKRALLPAKRRDEHSGWRRTRVVFREDSRPGSDAVAPCSNNARLPQLFADDAATPALPQQRQPPALPAAP